MASPVVQIDPRINSTLAKPGRLLINNRWEEAASGKTFPTYNPATGEILAWAAEGDKEDIDRAVRAARAAFERGRWPGMTTSERGRLIWKLADLIEANLEEFAELESLDNGKPLTVSTLTSGRYLARPVAEARAVPSTRSPFLSPYCLIWPADT